MVTTKLGTTWCWLTVVTRCRSVMAVRASRCPSVVVWLLWLIPLSISGVYFLSIMTIQEPSATLPMTVKIDDLAVDTSYKKSIKNPDGSIDIVLNIPKGDRVLKTIDARFPKKTSTELGSKRKLSNLNNYRENRLKTTENKTNVITKIRNITKTDYPLTISTPYMINNPRLCEGKKATDVLVLVHTAINHFVRRRLIRETWANKHMWKDFKIRTVFFLGQTTDKKLQTLVENESTVYNDLVQGMFTDTYKNLTHKGVLAYRWATEFCSNTSFILKVDDDMFVNIFKLIDEYIPRFANKSRQIGCHYRKKGTSPIERKGSKWNVDVNQFKNMTHFPMDYCNGYIVLMTPDLIKPMYQSSIWTPFFWVDDVYLYGMLPMKVGHVNFINIRPNLTILSRPGVKCFSNFTKPCNLLASGTGLPGTLEQMWKSTLLRLPSHFRTLINEGIV